MRNKVARGGEFKINSFTLVNQFGESIDLSRIAVDFKLHESIHEHFCSGEVIINDGINVLKNYRLTGQENIRISISQLDNQGQVAKESFSIDKTFRVYSVTDVTRNPKNMIEQNYRIQFCEPRVFYTKSTRLSQVFRGTWSNILQKGLIDNGPFKVSEFDHWEPTQNDRNQFICPNLSLQEFIKVCTRNADLQVEEGTFSRSMFFYQVLNGGFRFKSFYRMTQDEFPISFSYIPREYNDVTLIGANTQGGVNSVIKSFTRPRQFDTLEGLATGAYSSNIQVYDPLLKNTYVNVYDLGKMFKGNEGHVSGYPLIHLDDPESILSPDDTTENSKSPTVRAAIDQDLALNKSFFASTHRGFNANHIFDNTGVGEQASFNGIDANNTAMLERMSLMSILRQHVTKVIIPLRTDLSVGTIVQLKLPVPELQKGKVIEDEVNDDRYLITSLNVFGNTQTGTGELHFECVKESFAKNIADANPLSKATTGGIYR